MASGSERARRRRQMNRRIRELLAMRRAIGRTDNPPSEPDEPESVEKPAA